MERARKLDALCRWDLFEGKLYVDTFASASILVDQVPDYGHDVE